MASPIRSNFVAELGSEVGDGFYRLYVYWLEASVQFTEYEKLYGDEGNVKLLNAIGSQVFRNIQLIMQDSLILHITRLTDPPGNGTFRNLSLRMLLQRLKEDRTIPRPERFRDPEWLQYLEYHVDSVEEKAKYARRHRNQRIAHLDYETTMGLRPEPLRPLDTEEIKQTIDGIYRVIRYVHSAMYPGTDLLDMVSYQSGAGHFIAQESIRIGFLLYLDSLIDPEREYETLSDELAVTFFRKYNIELSNVDYESCWKHIELFMDFRKDVKEIRDKGIPGPPTTWP